MANQVDKNEVAVAVDTRVAIDGYIETIDMPTGTVVVRVGGPLNYGTGTSNPNPNADQRIRTSLSSIRKL